MREIKFRAYITYGYTTQELHDPGLLEEIQETGLGFIDTPDLIDFKNQRIKYDSEWYERDRFRLMQSTGLKDKNGVEIYEGDIIRTSEYGTGDRVNYRGYDLFNIIFKDGAFRLDSKYRAYFLNDGFYCEIIGNIYENPEIMEVDEQ